jgi:hypothetical protein
VSDTKRRLEESNKVSPLASAANCPFGEERRRRRRRIDGKNMERGKVL